MTALSRAMISLAFGPGKEVMIDGKKASVKAFVFIRASLVGV